MKAQAAVSPSPQRIGRLSKSRPARSHAIVTCYRGALANDALIYDTPCAPRHRAA